MAVLKDKMQHELTVDKNASVEIQELYLTFQTLIRTKKFESNDFMYKDDSLAVIDLAEACNMFENQETPNVKAQGICYNNIGNI